MTLLNLANEYNIKLDPKAEQHFDLYASLLCEWNEKINLTAITRPDEVMVKHFLDSLLVLDAVNLPNIAQVIDVGTGAGFPGVPMKIAREDIKLTLLDSLNKRVNFLLDISQKLGQSDNVCIHGRAEDKAKEAGLREKFDAATARAVASMSALCEYCLPFVKIGGVFIALKGEDVEDELGSAKESIKLLGGAIADIKKYKLPMGISRSIVVIEKISQTPPKYPRKGVKISKTPL